MTHDARLASGPAPSVAAPPAPPAGASPRPVVRDYGDPAAEYAALRTGALLVDRSHRARWSFRGERARETVAGLVTNDVTGLAPGQGCYAAALTAKGRIVADLRVLAFGEPLAASAGEGVVDPFDGVALLADVAPRAADGWAALVRKYVNPRVTPYRAEAERLRAIGIYGVRARDAVAAAFGAPPSALVALAPYAHATVVLGNTVALVVRVPDLGLDGFELILSAGQFDAAWSRLAAAAPGVTPGGELAYTVARIEAGYPEWGADMDESTIPQEANLDELRAISYTKGCYTGQEVVARVHFRGHVNRHLRGIAYLADGGPVPHGAELLDERGKVVGDVRSSAISPRLGGVAIGMVRREVPLGATLRAHWAGAADGAADPVSDGVAATEGGLGDEPAERDARRDGAVGHIGGGALASATERGVTVGTLPFPA